MVEWMGQNFDVPWFLENSLVCVILRYTVYLGSLNPIPAGGMWSHFNLTRRNVKETLLCEIY